MNASLSQREPEQSNMERCHIQLLSRPICILVFFSECKFAMMLKLKLQYFGHLMRRVDTLEKTLMLGGIGGRRRSG